jgi:hypothetical protein
MKKGKKKRNLLHGYGDTVAPTHIDGEKVGKTWNQLASQGFKLLLMC